MAADTDAAPVTLLEGGVGKGGPRGQQVVEILRYVLTGTLPG